MSTYLHLSGENRILEERREELLAACPHAARTGPSCSGDFVQRDHQRVERIQHALREQGIDALICAFPQHVLMLSGYWPVIGLSLAIATSEGHIALLVPEDEAELARNGWADQVHLFPPGSLTDLRPTREIVRTVLAEILPKLGSARIGTIGYEDDESSVPGPYSALHVFGASIGPIISEAVPKANIRPAGALLRQLQAVLTPNELDRVRKACAIANKTFSEGAASLRPGQTEAEVASAFGSMINLRGNTDPAVQRAGGWVWCMSGPNAAQASGAYARTRSRRLETRDFVLVHCNSYADGFWTDITRTFCLGTPDERQAPIYQAVFEAFRAAVDTVKAGVTGTAVDRAAREALRQHGFGPQFKHGTGHGVGFSAISPQARPRLHPVSPDILETGMVFNIEPAVYIEGYGGLRQCTMVGLTEHGPEILTPVLSAVEQLVIPV